MRLLMCKNAKIFLHGKLKKNHIGKILSDKFNIIQTSTLHHTKSLF